MDHTSEINNNIASAYLRMLNGESETTEISEDNTNDKSDDGEGMDKVQPKALKKKFKDRKDKDIDNDGDVDNSDEYLDNRRKAVSKEIDSDEDKEAEEPVTKTDRRKKLDKKGEDADIEAEEYGKKMKKEDTTKINELGNKPVVDQGALAKVQKKINSMGKNAPKIVKDKSGYFHIKDKSSVSGPFHTMSQVLQGLESMNKFPTNTSATQGKRMGEVESKVTEGFMDRFKKKKEETKSENAEQVKVSTEISKKLKLIDGLMQKVRPLGGNIGKLMAFRRLPMAKMTPKGMYIALNDWYHSVEDELDYGDDSVDLKKKYQRSVEDLYELWEEVGFKLKDYMWASGYNIKGIGQMAKIGFPAKKRTDPEWSKMNESMEKGMPAGEHVFGKEVDGKEIMVHKLDKSGKFCAYVDGKKVGEYDDLASAKSAAMNENIDDTDYNALGLEILRKNEAYKPTDSDIANAGRPSEIKPSKMTGAQKARARALSKADAAAQPKGKVSLKKAPWEGTEGLDEKANHVPQDETRDSFDKQVDGRRLTKTFNNELEGQMSEKQFVDMHNPKNADVPEFTNAPVVHAKTLQTMKDSVKAAPKRNGDATDGDQKIINPVASNESAIFSNMHNIMEKMKTDGDYNVD